MTIREQNLGSDHPRTASTYLHLARLYAALGRYEEAEPLYRKALIIRERALGTEHLAVATILEHYAVLLHAIGKEEEAYECEERTRVIRVKQAKLVN